MVQGMDLWMRTSETADGPYDGVQFEFGNINSIVTNLSPSVDQKPVIIYGYSRSLCMDKGVTKSYTVSFSRVNPVNPDNSSTSSTERWTNAKWLTAIQSLLNRWQAKTNGYILHIRCQYPDCFPTVDNENVFISAITLPKNNNTSQVVSGSISFKVGTLRLTDTPIVPEYTITYKPQDSSLDEFYDTASEGVMVSISYPPRDWVEYKMGQDLAFTGWATSSGTTAVAYRPQDQLRMERNMALYAVWRESIQPTVYRHNGTFTHTVGAEVHRVVVYCFGAGGAGKGVFSIQNSDYPYQNDLRGGGGGGALIMAEARVNPGDQITGYVGKGGVVGTDHNNGEASYFDLGGNRHEAGGGYSAEDYGGSGGAGGIPDDGGVRGHTGGSSNHKGEGLFGGLPGHTIPPSPSSNVFTIGGGGGGSVATTDGVSATVLSIMYGLCLGGNGGGAGRPYGEVYPTVGHGGCGGGGGYVVKMGNGQFELGAGANGGDGMVIVEEFYD